MSKKIKKLLFFFKQKLFFRKKINKISQNNIEFIIETRDQLGESWNLVNDYKFSEFAIFEKINKQNINTVYYFGAHQCGIPIKIQKIFLPNSHFYCFEARKSNYLVGKKNIEHNNSEKNISLFNEALDTEDGYTNFSLLDLNTFKVKNKIFSIKVKASSLENIINRFGKGQLFFFDIEGLEGVVLKKNINFLKSWQNYLFIECHTDLQMSKYDCSNEILVNLLLKNNYKLFKLKQDYNNQLEKFETLLSSDQIPKERYYLLATNY
jgi:FkbM family methyltransferase